MLGSGSRGFCLPLRVRGVILCMVLRDVIFPATSVRRLFGRRSGRRGADASRHRRRTGRVVHTRTACTGEITTHVSSSASRKASVIEAYLKTVLC